MERIVDSFRNVLNRGFCRSKKKKMSGSAPEKQRTKNNGGLEKHKTWFFETVEITEVAGSVPLITMRNNKLFFSEKIPKNNGFGHNAARKCQEVAKTYFMVCIFDESILCRNCESERLLVLTSNRSFWCGKTSFS